jgi:hypothetical protein
LAAAVAEQNPDVIAATFWLFTHQMQIEVLSRAVQLLDGVKVVCGGPEFLGCNEEFLRRNAFVNAVVRGEGEVALPNYLDAINDTSQWPEIEGLCWMEDGVYHDNGIASVSDFAALKYPEESSFFNWDKPFVQLETTRGCFNTCAFCVSGGQKPVRYQSIDQVAARLKNIYEHGIRDVRVLDRTFNYDIARACDMLDLFTQYAGRMRFHLEIHPSLLTDRLKKKLSELPEGLLHLEAGIQSLHSSVLAASGRKGSLETSLDGLEYLASLPNVETHADLIAGLPEYSLDMLCKDIIRLIETGVDELQIESLKVLPGTKMRDAASQLGLRFSPLPPYEVLRTSSMSPSELRLAMQFSRTIDLYYNSDPWQEVFRELVCSHPEFLTAFTAHLRESMVLDSPVSLERRGVILYEYCRAHYPEHVCDVSIAWILAGFSLKKEPAGNVIKIKHCEEYLEEPCPTLRYYLYSSNDRQIIFGYDSETHQPKPVYIKIQ